MALKMLGKSPVKAPAVQVETAPVAVLEPPPVLVQPVVPETELEALTTEYIELWRKFEYFEVKALVKRMEEIRKALVSVANETMESTKPVVFTSGAGDVEFSERATQAVAADPLALIQVLHKKFGPEVAASCVSIALTPLRKVLSEFELKQHLVDVPGSRTMRAVRPAP